MKKHIKNRKGFTLVEMILSIAIICMIGGVIGGICAGISSSFISTYNMDDSYDYAALYAKGFENSFLSSTQDSTATDCTYSWKVASEGTSGIPYLIRTDGTTSEHVFEPRFMGNSTTNCKWDVHMFYKYFEDGNVVYYCIFIKDNYSNTDFVCFYEGSFWVPRFSTRVGGDSREIAVDTNSLPLNETTFLNEFHYSSDEYAKIHEQVESRADDDWYSTITYSC